HLQAAARRQRESKFAVAVRGIAGEPEQAAEKRTRAPHTELLASTGRPLIDREAQAGLLRPLVRVDPLERKSFAEIDVERAADKRRGVHIEGASGGDLEQ